jgi:hypothetical protein
MLVYLTFFLEIIIFVLLYFLFRNKKYYFPTNFISREEMSLYRKTQEEFLKELQNLTESSLSQIEEKLKETREILNLIEKESQKLSTNLNLIQKNSHKEKEEIKVDERTSKIYELRDRGLSIYEIAKEVGISKGEVELILNLRKKING